METSHVDEDLLEPVVGEKLAEVFNPTLGLLKAKKTKELGGKQPDANIPKVVSFPTTS